ncbi:MAG: hypothetical protein ACLQBY_04995 [Solirubrobacteraceae bacterium]
MADRSPRLELIAPAASPEEAAAIVAALERFMRATAPAASPAASVPDGWRRAAVLEGVSREPEEDVSWMFPTSG